jgi:hypothetical protein
MPKKTNVVPITTPKPDEKPRIVAQDEVSRRIILAIGPQRVAFDLSTRITRLPPETGDKPATVHSVSDIQKPPRRSS